MFVVYYSTMEITIIIAAGNEKDNAYYPI